MNENENDALSQKGKDIIIKDDEEKKIYEMFKREKMVSGKVYLNPSSRKWYEKNREKVLKNSRLRSSRKSQIFKIADRMCILRKKNRYEYILNLFKKDYEEYKKEKEKEEKDKEEKEK